MTLLLFIAAVQAAGLTPEEEFFFETKIRPVLAEKCYSCHSAQAESVRANLLLDTREGSRRGGANGPAVVPGDLLSSLLTSAIRWHDEDTGMPPQAKGGRLPDRVIADFERWIVMGAPDPRYGGSALGQKPDPAAARSWWAYQPVRTPVVPQPQNSAWARTDIDKFILSSLEARQLMPVEDAAPASLLRRVYLDLAGLPPPPEGVEQFIARPDLTAVVDSLLRTRQFAERWARHWLDVVRYAEPMGQGVNAPQPEAWRYRDYVIDSFMADKPFDQFIREQIAGDLLPDSGNADRTRKLIATGFLTIGSKSLHETDDRHLAVDLADKQIDAVSQAFLAQSISCARCHDHKFDPVSQRDYTALAGIFLSPETRFGTVGGGQARNPSGLIEVPDRASLTMLERSSHPRPQHGQEDGSVPRGLPAFLSHDARPLIAAEESGRLQLASWISAPDNTLTSRVWVNRVWSWLLGSGLVSSVDNFGSTGARPSHPALLDHLAQRFMRQGWSVKRLVREIVLSRVYQLAAQHEEKNFAADPDNGLLWRMSGRRLDAETVRDAVLAVSGDLDPTPQAGSAIGRAGDGLISGGRLQDLKEDAFAQEGGRCRSLYLPIDRTVPPETRTVFDFTDPAAGEGASEAKSEPPQALNLMHSEFVSRQSAKMAARVIKAVPQPDFAKRFSLAFLLAYSRGPTASEMAAAQAFLAAAATESEAWTSICRALLGSAEFRLLN